MTYPPDIVAKAIDLGLRGDQVAGCVLLQPLVDQGPKSTYVLLGMLAEAAAFVSRTQNGPSAFYALQVSSALDGKEASADDLPPPVRFASQFVTAWANEDYDQAHALFEAFAGEADRIGSLDLGEAIGIVYGIAVASAQDLVQGQGPSR
ncbi:hypothetical protein ACWCQE_27675 [Streptomyces sp. NPDC002409]|uniref:hypothetical protein n=1 Tax=Streptomyces misionensis TaxID=67331 RepID=UPI00368452D0